LQHLSKLSVLASAEYGGDLVFQTVDGLLARRDARPPLLRQDDEFRASVDGVGLPAHLAELFELVDEFAHRLRRHTCAAG